MELSPDRRLLLACARAKLTAGDRRRILELAGDHLDWGPIAAVSYAHGIAPLIYHSVQQSGAIGSVPEIAAQTLRRSYYINAARNSLLYDQLRKLLVAVGRGKNDIVVLKGAALAETVYTHVALRPMSDIDLLVSKERLAAIEAELLNMGYVLNERENTRAYWQEHHHHLVFEGGFGVTFEIHWHIKRPGEPFRINIDGLWNRSRPTKIAGVDALVLSPEDLLLHLSQHLWKHRLNGGIRPLCDIAEAAKHYAGEIDWSKLADLSAEWEINQCSYLGLSLAKELLEAPIPENVLESLKPLNFDMEVIGPAKERLLAHGETSLVFPDLLKLLWKDHSFKERCAVLQKALSRRTFAGYAKEPSASAKAYVYYPLRIKRLLTRYGPAAYRLLVGNSEMRTAAEAAVEGEEKQQRLTKWLSEA